MPKIETRMGTGPVPLDLPDEWKVNYLPIASAPTLTADQMRNALAHPIGTPRIRDLARGKRTAAIIVDDLTRPTPAYAFVPLIIEELKAAGVDDGGIKIIGGIGCHRPMVATDFRRKVGDEVVDRYVCVTHNPYEHHVCVGTTPRGTRVEINDEVAEADVRIAAGGIIPHGSAGFGGGAKLIAPGVSSIDTIIAMHKLNPKGKFYTVDENEIRDEMEQIARLAGLDVIVNCVMNANIEVAGLFVGDLVAAHRAGARAALDIYTVRAPRGVDAAIISRFPKDWTFEWSPDGRPGCASTVREDGTVLLLIGGTEGNAFHYLLERRRKDSRFASPGPGPTLLGSRHLIVHSPILGPRELATTLPSSASIHRDVGGALDELRARHPQATVNVFPQAPLTILADD